jgi:hypothetical protein
MDFLTDNVEGEKIADYAVALIIGISLASLALDYFGILFK